MEQTQATLRRLEAFLTSHPALATTAAATATTAAPTIPAAVATPIFHGPMAPPTPNLEAARPRFPEAFDPSAKGSDVRRFVAILEIYFEAIGFHSFLLFAISVISIHPATESSRGFDRPISRSHEELRRRVLKLRDLWRGAVAPVHLAPLACSSATRACAARRVASAAAVASGGGRAGTLFSCSGGARSYMRVLVHLGWLVASTPCRVAKRPDACKCGFGYSENLTL
ncbi:unnamed protein product [Closterium sp. NIES-54]